MTFGGRLGVDPPGRFGLSLGTPLATVRNWEGYRYLRFTATPHSFASRTITITVASKQYEFAVGDDGVAADVLIDLCHPVNLPADFIQDERDTRYPLQGGSTPIAQPPKIDDADEKQNGWLTHGVLDRPTEIGFSALGVGETLDVANIRLTREASCELSCLMPFKAEVLGWEAEDESSTYLDPDIALYSDKKPIDWPARAHVVPLASAESWVWWTNADLASWIAYPPGWNCAALAAPTDRDWLGPSLQASNLTPLIFVRPSWVWQIGLNPSSAVDLYSCYQAHRVDWYPGVGRSIDDGWGAGGADLELYVSKVVRSQAEGLVFPPESQTVEFIDQLTGSDGSATVDAIDGYRTGSAYGKGNRNHRTQLAVGTNPFEGPFVSHNRYRHRTSFVSLSETPGTYPSYDVSSHQRHYRAFLKDDGKAWAGWAQNSFAGGWHDASTTLDAVSVCVRVDRTAPSQTIYLEVESAGSCSLYRSVDLASWSLMTSIGTGAKPAFCVDPRGRIYSYRIDAGAVKGDIRDRAGTLLWSGTPSGLPAVDDAGLAIDWSLTGGKIKLILLAVVSGIVKQYVSANGKAFA